MKKYIARFACAVLALVLLTAPACALTVPEALELLEERYYLRRTAWTSCSSCWATPTPTT